MLLYACTIFLSAFLLFQVQPVIAKMILPWFGGSAAVWTTCMLFFQVVLLLGYLYVYSTVRLLSPKVHARLHAGLLVLSLALLPITPGAQWKPAAEKDPSIQILVLLAVCVGSQYFLLSTTSPLLQSWYSRAGKGALPYRLFALSNLGSMLALLTYPALFEPMLPSKAQGTVWSTAYVVFVGLCAATALVSTAGSKGTRMEEADRDAGDAGPAPDARALTMWAALAACPSALLLAVTNHLTQDVASIPFLWIVPLAIYLLTFILCFDSSGWYRRPVFLILLAPSLGGMAYMLHKGTEDFNMRILLGVFSTAFFVCCMVCHGELVRMKPHPRYLTSFYLMLSVGGAAGGIFVGLVAPYLFRSYFEFPIAIVLCAFLAFEVLVDDPKSRFYQKWTNPVVVLFGAGVLILAVLVGQTVRQNVSNYKVVKRNFYGSLRVREEGSEWDAYRTLLHGSINHGENWIHPDRRRQPLTYYCADSGVGRAIRSRPTDQPNRIGVFGLGAGSIAGYTRPGDTVRFYEINPLVVDLANSEFYYLREARGKVEIALGDARLSLERDPQQNFDVLAVDCFSGDSIPVHLLTKQAVELYFRHLKADGILALHISNRFLELEPVVEKIAATLGKKTYHVETEDDDEGNCFGATWVLLASDEAIFRHPAFENAGKPLGLKPGPRLWTDDYSSLFGILK